MKSLIANAGLRRLVAGLTSGASRRGMGHEKRHGSTIGQCRGARDHALENSAEQRSAASQAATGPAEHIKHV